MMHPHIVQRLQNIATSLPVIKVELRNFGSLPSHTIYINITSKIPIINIVKAVRQAQSLMKIDKDRKPVFHY
jgi:bifunctional DNase/RNase